MRQRLLDAINNGKISGEVQAIEISYSTPDLSPIVIDHPKLEGVQIIPGTFMTAEQFNIEIVNAFTQWQLFLNTLYGQYISLEFTDKKDNPDINIVFNASTIQLVSLVSAESFELNLGINWSTINASQGPLLLNYVVRGVGMILGVSDTTVLSPMNPSYLGVNYLSVFNINISENGYITICYLNNYKSIANNVITIYGVSNSNTPLIFGCTDVTAENYDPEATINNGSCLPTVSSNRDARTNDALIYYTDNSSEYFLANNSSLYEYSVGTFENPIDIVGQNDSVVSALPLTFSDSSYQLTSLVITDKEAGAYGSSIGEPRYYMLISQAGDLNIFNSDGQLLSRLSDQYVYSNEINTSSFNSDLYLSNLNINYQSDGINAHRLTWVGKNGYLNSLKLNDVTPQLDNSGNTISACNLDTYTHGNIDNFNYTNIGGQILNSRGEPLQVVNGKFVNEGKLVGRGYGIVVDSGDGTTVITGEDKIFFQTDFPDSISRVSTEGYVNNKVCMIPTINGVHALALNLDSNFLEITNLNSYSGSYDVAMAAWMGDQEMFSEGTYTESDLSYNNPANIDNNFENFEPVLADAIRPIVTRNTSMDCSPLFSRNTGTGQLLRPFSLGFSFDSTSIFNISSKTWVDGQFAGEGDIPDKSLFSSLPLTIGNKLFRNSFFCNTNNISLWAWAVPTAEWFSGLNYYGSDFHNSAYENSAGDEGSYNDLRHVGDFHLAIAVKHGFILTKVNNTNFSLVSPTSEDGIELHVSGGDPTMDNFNGGWTPISMEFSPDDNFLYTIIQNPLNSSEKKIAIYNINYGTGEGPSYGCNFTAVGISTTVRVIDLTENLDVDLQKVTLQDDGCIYFWSSVNEYLKVTDPDLNFNVDSFIANPIVTSLSGATYLPSRSYLHNKLEAITPSLSFSNIQFTNDDFRVKYAEVFNSNEPAININSGTFPINDFEYNSKIIGAGVTFDVVSNTVNANTEPSNEVIEAVATQTSNGLSLNILAYVIAKNGTVQLKGYDGTLIAPSMTSITDGDFRDSVFIFPEPLRLNTYICGYVLPDLSIELHSFTATDSSTDYDGSSYTYEIGENISFNVFLQTQGNTTNNFTGKYFIPGNKVIKTKTNKHLIFRTLTDTISSENKQQLYLIADIYENNSIVNSNTTFPIHSILEDKLVSAGDNFSIENCQLYTNICISSDNKLIAVGTMSKSAIEPFTECVISVYNLNINTPDNLLGSQVGESVQMSYTNFLVNEDGQAMTDTVIRGLEFSPNNTKLYVLLGKHGVYQSATIDVLSKSNRILRLDINKGANTFDFDGPLFEPSQYNQPSAEGSRSGNYLTYTDGLSDQGNPYYRVNSAPVGLYLNPSGDIFIANKITYNLDSSDGSSKVMFIGGVITNSDNTDTSRLFRTGSVRVNLPGREEGQIISLGFALNNVLVTGGKDPIPEAEFSEFDIVQEPPVVVGPTGCTDPFALNYDPLALSDDGSCVYLDGAAQCTGLNVAVPTGTLDDLPLVQQILNDKMDIAFEDCGVEGPGGGAMGGDRAARTIIPSYDSSSDTIANPNCGDQCYYEITMSMSVDTEDGNAVNNPWFSNLGFCDVITVEHTFVFIPAIVYTNGEDFYGGYSLDSGYVNMPGNYLNFLTGDPDTGNPIAVWDGTFPAGQPQPGLPSFYPWSNTHNWITFGNPSAPANFYDADTFNPEYCLTCTNPDAPNFVADGSVSTADCTSQFPWCVSYDPIDQEGCGVYGCTNPNACNYDSTATHNQGCEFPVSYTNQHGVAIGDICGCNGFINPLSALDYCGDCSDPDNMYLRSDTPGCDCNGNPLLVPGGGNLGYYADCAGTLPTDIEQGNGCYYDINGVLQEPAGGLIGVCDCQGTTVFGTGCECNTTGIYSNTELVNPQTWCDCNTSAQRYYPDGDVINGIANCDAQSILVCEIENEYSFSVAHNNVPQLAFFHGPLAGASVGDYIDIITGNIYTAATMEGYIQASTPAYVECEPCALAGPNGEEQEYNNCIPPGAGESCKYLVNNTTGVAYFNPIYEDYYYNEECAQCLPIVGETACCAVNDDGEQILDACGNCINLVQDSGGIIVEDVAGAAEGNYKLTLYYAEGQTIDTHVDCNPCYPGGPITANGFVNNASSPATLAQFQALSSSEYTEDYGYGLNEDYCNACGGDAQLTTWGRFPGYIQGTSAFKCSCEENWIEDALLSEHAPTNDCCPGYFWDSCAFGGQGGCRENGTPAIPKDCTGITCGQIVDPTAQGADVEYIFTHEINGCGECTEMVNIALDEDPTYMQETGFTPGTPGYLLGAIAIETYNDSGCCGSEIIDCTNECVDPAYAQYDDPCGVCGGDSSTCTGCTDPDAYNWGGDNTIVDDGSCIYSSLYTILNEASIYNFDLNGATPILHSEYVWAQDTISNALRLLISVTPDKIPDIEATELYGFEIYIDQQYYTQRCQIISLSNTILYISNPLVNAEISYTNANPYGTIIDQQIANHPSYQNVAYDNASSVMYTAKYHFALDKYVGPELTETNIATIFQEHAGKIAIIKHISGNFYSPAGLSSGGYAPGSITETIAWDTLSPIQVGDQEVTGIDDTNDPLSTLLTPSIQVRYIYEVIPNLDPITGLPYAFSLDFSQFIFTSVPGCMDPAATNYNENANTDDGSCEYEVIEPGAYLNIWSDGIAYPTNSHALKWVLYDDNNNVVRSNFGYYPSSINTEDYSTHLGTFSGCLYFLPIGFKYNDVWQEVSLSISDGLNNLVYLTEGNTMSSIASDPENKGSFLLDGSFSPNYYQTSPCVYGCTDNLNVLKTDYCKATIRKDVKEFTDIDFKFEVSGVIREGYPLADDLGVKIIIYNLDTGDRIIQLPDSDTNEEGLVQNVEHVGRFAIDTQTRIGIRIDNPGNLSMKYELVSEYGDIIKKKIFN